MANALDSLYGLRGREPIRSHKQHGIVPMEIRIL